MWLDKFVISRWIVVAVIVLGAMTWGYFIITGNRVSSSLPVFGEVRDDKLHEIPEFKLINQDGIEITEKYFDDKIYVTDFFFVNCDGICPVMNNQLKRVAERFSNNDNVLILSHTVKPEEDSIPALKEYAKAHSADSLKWQFVTGDRKVINDLARNSYLLGDGETSDDFVHTQFFALIDSDKHIRGFYDGTDSSEVNKLMADIDILSREE